MSNCCNKPKYYIYNEFVLISESMSTITGDNFAIKLVYDEIDLKGELVKDGKLVLTSLFEKIGKNEYSVITDIAHHLSDKKTSKTTVTHSIAFLSEDDLKKYPADILAEFIFNSVVTSKLSVTSKNKISTSLYNTFQGSMSIKQYSNKKSKNYNKQTGKDTGVWSINKGVSITVGSSSFCSSQSLTQKSCEQNCDGSCINKPQLDDQNLYSCSCNSGGCGKKFKTIKSCTNACTGSCTITPRSSSYSCTCTTNNTTPPNPSPATSTPATASASATSTGTN